MSCVHRFLERRSELAIALEFRGGVLAGLCGVPQSDRKLASFRERQMGPALERNVVADFRTSSKHREDDAAKTDIASLAPDLHAQDPGAAARSSNEQVEALAVAMTTFFCILNKFSSETGHTFSTNDPESPPSFPPSFWVG